MKKESVLSHRHLVTLSPCHLVAFGIILDDLVFPDGRTAMGTLGGGGPQTAFGMRLPGLAGWTEQSQVCLVAGVGHDLPPSAREWLESAGIDRTGVRETELPTPRAWQLLEADGRRTQVWRVQGRVVGAQLGRSLEHIPASYRQARGFHLGIHPEAPDLEFIRQLRDLRPPIADRRPPLVSLEPFKPADRPPTDAALRQLCSAADIFSPNLTEARSLVGQAAPDELARRLADAGARIVTLRMGAEGSLIGAKEEGIAIHVPAVPATVFDPTGAGNAYGGGFLAGYIQTGDLMMAACYATIAASFLVEQVGLPPINDRLRDEANRRLQSMPRTRDE
jgi:sugar/nucleoside kinase (ribokinase family)